MSKCKGCGAEILWIKTTRGKNMPCEPRPATYYPGQDTGAHVVTPTGHVHVVSSSGPAIYGHRSHFADCPAADMFRR